MVASVAKQPMLAAMRVSTAVKTAYAGKELFGRLSNAVFVIANATTEPG